MILIVFVGGMCGSVEKKAFTANMELLGFVEGEKRFHSKTTCMEVAGGARSSIEELLCVA